MTNKTKKVAAKSSRNYEKSLHEATELMEKGDMLAEYRLQRLRQTDTIDQLLPTFLERQFGVRQQQFATP